MTLEVTGIEPEEVETYIHRGSIAFGSAVQPADVAYWGSMLELDRALAVRDGGLIVGTAAGLSMDVSVPGGSRLPMAGITAVTVLPTHHRRGIASGLMARLHRQARERGEPVAGLWASESSIYGRMGYGSATSMADRELSTAHAAFARPPDGAGAVRLVEPGEAVPLVRDLLQREGRRTPGVPGLDEVRAGGWLGQDPEHWRGGASPRYLAAAGDRGVVAYRVARSFEHGLAAGQASVELLLAADAGAWAALWHYLCTLDLVAGVSARGRPVDEPLGHLLVDPRRARVAAVRDALWLRVLDVAALLSGRAYATDGAATIEVLDADGLAAGRWRLEADGGAACGGDPDGGDAAGGGGPAGGAACRPTTATADVTLPVASLGAACLGGTRLTALARAGLADEHTPGSLRHLDLMLSSNPQPWCPFDF